MHGGIVCGQQIRGKTSKGHQPKLEKQNQTEEDKM